MKAKWISGMGAIVLAAALSAQAVAHDHDKKAKPHSAAEIKKDIANHRAMAEAHLNAAKCLEGGKSEKECHAQLAKDCKGLAIGKYCGMRHSH
ncbi:MAG: hypothetical protein KIT18_12535 [Burkholderiales bacterium]|nr:hypothetical protein [Burkholderiales bacterium]